MKTKFIKLLSTTLLFTCLCGITACGGGGTSSTSGDPSSKGGSSEPGPSASSERKRHKKISFLHIWPEHSDTLQEIVNDFMAENPEITVEVQQSTHSDIDTYLQMQALSQSYPDVFFYWTHQMSNIIDLDCALPLNNYADGWKDTFINKGEAWDLAKFDGNYTNVPFRSTGYIIVYNKTLFNELKLSVPKTIEEFETVLATLRNYSKQLSFSPLALSGVTSSTLPQLHTAFESFVNLQSEVYKDPHYSSGTIRSNAQQNGWMGKVLEKLKDWNNKYYFGYCEGKREATCISDFVNLNAAMVLMNNNNLDLLNDLPKDIDIGLFAIPAPAALNGYTYVFGGFDGFCVSKYTKNPEESIKFLKYLTSYDVQTRFGNEALSVMAVDGIKYESEKLNMMKEALRDVGNPLLKQNDVQYSVGTLGENINSMYLNFILGKSTKTGEQLVTEIAATLDKAIEDEGVTLYDRVQPVPSSFNISWLDIGKI